jgi:hypothetical protein
MYRILLVAVSMFALVSEQSLAQDARQLESYTQGILVALNTKAAAYESAFAQDAEPSSGTVKLTVKPQESRIVTVEPNQPADAMWHMGINEIAWGTSLPQPSEELKARYHSIQFSVVVTLDAKHKYSFSSIKPVNGLVFVSFE